MVEMLFAILLLSIVLLGLVSVLGSILRNQAEGKSYGRGISDRRIVPERRPKASRPRPLLDRRKGIGSRETPYYQVSQTEIALPIWRDHLLTSPQ